MTIALAALTMITSASSAELVDLQCEYQGEPLVVESSAPRLSWIAKATEKNWRQSAYEILVASNPAFLAKDQGDLWSSGRVTSDASIQIPYTGKKLTSRQAAFWKVRVWDSRGVASGWSKPSKWEVGLLSDSDWSPSVWIGGPGATSPEPAPHLRREFEVHGSLARARIYASGVGNADIHLNGKKVGNGERDPGYTNFDKRLLYVGYDVTHQLKQGTNAIGAILGTGWFDTHDQATWNFDKAPWRGQPRMRLVLVLDYKDGRTEQVTSDGTWKTSAGPILVDGIYTGEVYDARKEIPGWDRAGYDDSSWSPAKVVEAPRGALSGMQCPPIVISQSFKPKTISEPKPGVYILDFGQNFSGHVRLKVKGSAGDKVTMRYSERLDDTGMIQRKEIDVYMTKATPPQPFQTDVYILKGGALESWEQRFSYAGFRYVEVTGFPGKPTLENFEGRFAHTDLASAGEFECSHPLLNQIQHATKWAYLSNAQSIPTDCPQREKNGWTGDAHLACEAGLMNFRSAPFYTKWLDDYADDQKADGRFSLIIPSGGWGAGACHPSWDSAFAIIAEDLHEYLGDARLLEKHYDHLKRYVDYLEGQLKDDVIPFDSLGDWLPWETQTPSQLTSSAMVVVDAEIVSKAAKMLGKAEEAAKYSALATRVRTGIDRKFYEPATLDSLSQTALSVGLYFKLIDPAHRQAAFGALVRNVERQGHIDTGIIGAKFILRVLSEAGRTDLAYKIVARTEQPGWGWWMEQRATTLWEDWKGESSLNHIMFGDVSNWFMQWIAGIGLDPSSPAFKHILIRPQPVGDLTWANAHHDSPYGRISSSWKKTHGAFHLEIEIPANTSATVTVPGKVAKAEGAILVRSEAEVTVFEVGSGKYVFDAKM